MSNQLFQTKIKYPIIIIPGVCGSKLIGTDKKTGKSRIVWVNGSLQYAHVSSKFLWGKNLQDGLFHSFVEDYTDIYPKPGIQGIDQMVELQILSNYTNYFGKLINYLVKHEGYEMNKNIFAYSYDWRQDISHECIQKPLNQLIKDVMAAHNGQKVIMITHSMGGLVAEQYMRSHPDEWDQQIIHLLTLMTPFNGSSGWANISQIIGYNLQLPCPLSTAKGIQANSISPLYLQIRKNANSSDLGENFLPEQPQLLQTFGQIYIKKAKENNPFKILKQKFIHQSKDSIKGQLCKKFIQGLNQKILNLQKDDIKLNESVYENKVPDVAFILAKRILDNPALINSNEFGITMRMLQQGCASGSMIIKNLKTPIRLIREVNLFDAHTIKLSGSHKYYEWEVYHPWASDPTYTIPYTYQESRYMKVVENDINFTQEFFTAFNHYKSQDIIYSSTFQHIKEFVVSLQYWHESQNINFVQQQIVPGCGCTKRKQSSEYTRNKYSYPWSSPASRLNYNPESLQTLLAKMHPEGTLEHILYGTDNQIYETAKKSRSIPLKIPKNTQFRFTSISGCGKQTPLHAVFETPVQNYTEISSQIPKMLQADGDGTVLLTAALSDPFPNEVVNDRILVRNQEHFGFLQQKSSFELISSILRDIQIK